MGHRSSQTHRLTENEGLTDMGQQYTIEITDTRTETLELINLRKLKYVNTGTQPDTCHTDIKTHTATGKHRYPLKHTQTLACTDI